MLFVLVSLLSGFGSTAMTLAAGIWVLSLTGNVALAALTGLCIYLPTLAAPWLGAVVDRVPRRPLLIGVDLGLGLILLSLLTVHDAGQVWLIFAVLLVRGASYVLLDAGETAILPAALPRSALGDVNGWRSSAQEGMKLVAPLAGAGLFAWRGPVPVVLLGAAMPLFTAGCYALLRLNSGVAGRQAVPGTIREGLRVLFGNPVIRTPVLVAAVAIGLSGLNNAAVLARIVHGLDLPATYLGFVTTAQGAGSILSGLLVGRLLARLSAAKVATIGAVLFSAGCLAWCLPWFAAALTGSVLIGLGLPWTLIAGVTAVQTGTPDHLLGRVSATAGTVMFGPVALAIPLGAALVQLGARGPLFISAGLALVAATVPAWRLSSKASVQDPAAAVALPAERSPR